jgi:hypothetical protein
MASGPKQSRNRTSGHTERFRQRTVRPESHACHDSKKAILWTGDEIPRVVFAVFGVVIVAAMLGYYLVWKYVIGFFNRMLEIG